MPAMFTRGLMSSMITATMRSLSVVWRLGSAASRRTMVEYWFWSATQKRIGSEDLKNGAQNKSIGDGRERYQAKTPTRASTPKMTAYNLVPGRSNDDSGNETLST